MAAAATAARGSARGGTDGVRIWKIHYRTHAGLRRAAYVVLPAWYGPLDHPPLPLIISPHGRGIDALLNARVWSGLPAQGPFAVISPEGQGRKLIRYSWGYAGQIDDLARMPSIVQNALPWLAIDSSRIYAFGNSMGGEETLLLAAQHPDMLAGAAVFDAVTNLRLQYYNFPHLGCNAQCRAVWHGPIGRRLQRLARVEIGGTPTRVPRAYARRSPISFVRSLSLSALPLQVWWSTADRVVLDQELQSGELVRRIRELNPEATVDEEIGQWRHGTGMTVVVKLPEALRRFGLLPAEPAQTGE